MPIKSNIITAEELNEIIARETTNFIILTDRFHNIQYVNEAFSEFTGYQLSYCKGKKSTLLQGTSRDSAIEVEIPSIPRTVSYSNEIIRNHKKDGSEYWVKQDISPIYDSAGRIKNYIAIQTNITELIKSRQDENRSEIKLRALFDSSSNLNLVLDKEFMILDFNNAAALFAEVVTGATLRKGQKLKEFSSDLSWKRFMINFDNSWSNKLPLHLETEISLSNDDTRWFKISYDPVLNSQNKVEVMLMSLTDIDSVKENEHRLITQNQILAGIADIYAHDVRGPVATLMGLLNLIDNDYESTDSLIGKIRKTTIQLDKTVRSISKLSTATKENELK